MARSKLKPLTEYRQSTLQGMETCARRTRFAIEAGDDSTTGWMGSSAALGTVAHAVFAAILEALRHPEWGDVDEGDGTKTISTQEAVEIMYETMAASTVVLPYADQQTLLGLTLEFCTYKFRPQSILAIEQRLRLPLVCPDGRTRILKGQPDLVSSNPPHGLDVDDFKTGQGRPRKPQDKDLIVETEGVEVVIGRKYLSDRGHFQGDTYGLLVLDGFLDDGSQIAPSATHVTFRERHMRSREWREVRINRDDLEHIRRRLALVMQRVDEAIQGGPRSPLWKPRPGKHCAKQCPVARSCPIPREQRGDGAIATQHQADATARQHVVAKAQAEQTASQLKAWQEAENAPGRVNEHETVRWGPDTDAVKVKGGGRSFKLWPDNGNGGK